jgi:hypothetical protein
MSKLLLTLSIALSLMCAASTRAGDNGYVTRVIHETDSIYSLAVQPKRWIKITNFIQQGGNAVIFPAQPSIGAVTVYQGAQGLSGITVAIAGGADSVHEVVIAGPAIVNVAPVTGGTLFLTYLAGTN